MAPASNQHQDIADFLTALLRFFVETRQTGIVRSAPFQMKTGSGLPGREPDIIYVANANSGRLKDVCLDGPADIAVEIVSPSSRSRDRGEKFYEYEQGGVSEYWLIDPLRQQAEFYELTDTGIYQFMPIDRNGVFHSNVLPRLWLKIEWLWQETLPPLLSVLKEWNLL